MANRRPQHGYAMMACCLGEAEFSRRLGHWQHDHLVEPVLVHRIPRRHQVTAMHRIETAA